MVRPRAVAGRDALFYEPIANIATNSFAEPVLREYSLSSSVAAAILKEPVKKRERANAPSVESNEELCEIARSTMLRCRVFAKKTSARRN